MEKIVLEKKTQSEYRIQKFKDKHEYDPKSKTIKMDDGKRVAFRYINDGNHKNEKSLPKAGINYKNQSPTITMNKKSFNMKNPQSHEFIMKHEYGHKKDYDFDNENQNHISNKQKLKGKDSSSSHDHDPREYVADYYASSHIKNGQKVAKKTLSQFQKEDIKTGKVGMKDFNSEMDKKIKKEEDYITSRKKLLKQRETEYSDYKINHKNDPNFKGKCSDFEQTIDILKEYIDDSEKDKQKFIAKKKMIKDMYNDQISGHQKRINMNSNMTKNKEFDYIKKSQ